MAYEFEPGTQNGPIAQVPQFWSAEGRIFQEIPNNPMFVFGSTIIEDSKTGHIGVDTNDYIPAPEAIGYGMNRSIGMLRVVLEEPPIDGYIVDLRYRTGLMQRELGFTYLANAMAAELNETTRNVPALGAIFWDAKAESLHFQCENSKRARLLPFAASLLRFVDAEYLKREIPTVGEGSDLSVVEPTNNSVARDLQ